MILLHQVGVWEVRDPLRKRPSHFLILSLYPSVNARGEARLTQNQRNLQHQMRNSENESNTKQRFNNNIAEAGAVKQQSAWQGKACEMSFLARYLCLVHIYRVKLIF